MDLFSVSEDIKSWQMRLRMKQAELAMREREEADLEKEVMEMEAGLEQDKEEVQI